MILIYYSLSKRFDYYILETIEAIPLMKTERFICEYE